MHLLTSCKHLLVRIYHIVVLTMYLSNFWDGHTDNTQNAAVAAAVAAASMATAAAAITGKFCPFNYVVVIVGDINFYCLLILF